MMLTDGWWTGQNEGQGWVKTGKTVVYDDDDNGEKNDDDDDDDDGDDDGNYDDDEVWAGGFVPMALGGLMEG